ncbi:hypothetical protein AVEN_207110-1 [Araneus ventricosus]|uniref:Uncharacterized protein n=1 Tax=Araneus ventricosus TaxID=182803 RepID=A0A4Y2WET8_ARAVE|nr:hypothetical protein AVEN_207110-1 [Araneus ventricosus]
MSKVFNAPKPIDIDKVYNTATFLTLVRKEHYLMTYRKCDCAQVPRYQLRLCCLSSGHPDLLFSRRRRRSVGLEMSLKPISLLRNFPNALPISSCFKTL